MASNSGFQPGEDVVQVPREPYFRPPHLESATGQLAAGAGKFFDDLVSVGDTFFKNTIDQKARDQVDIVQRTSNEQAQAILAANNVPVNVPDAISRGTEQANTLTTAKNIGKVNNTNYEAQMDLIARKLRGDYPGYRDFIDDTMAKLMGHTPANLLHRALDAQLQALGQGAANTTQRIAHIEDRLAEGGLSIRTDPDYVAIKAKGNPDLVLDYLNHTEAQRNAYKAQTQAAHAQLSNEHLGLQVSDMANSQAAGNLTSNSLADFMERLKADPKYQTTVNKLYAAEEKEKRGEMMTPQERADIVNTFNGIRQQYMSSVWAPMKAKMFAGVPAAKIAELDKTVGSWFDAMLHGVDHPGFIKAQEDMLASRKHFAEWDLLSKNGAMETFGAMNRVLSPQVTSIALTDPKIQGPFINTMSNAIFAKVASGSITSVDEAFKEAKKTGFDKETQYDGLLNKSFSALGQKNIVAEGANNIYNHLFSNENRGFINNISDTNLKVKYFTEMLSGANLNSYERLYKEGKISQEQFKNSMNWAEETAPVVLRDSFNILNRFSAVSKNYDVTFDKAAKAFMINPVKGSIAEKMPDQPIIGETRPPINTVGNINKVLLSLWMTAEKTGENPDAVIQRALRAGMYQQLPNKPNPVNQNHRTALDMIKEAMDKEEAQARESLTTPTK